MKPELIAVLDLIFNEHDRFLCDSCLCPNEDGYCPRYACALIDKLHEYTEQQWQTTLNKVHKTYPNLDLSMGDLCNEILDILIKKRPRRKLHEQTQLAREI